eukprot:2349492-Prymnesium_polylepis.1
MSRQQRVVRVWTRARALTAGAPRAGARDTRASRAVRLAEGQRCAILVRLSFQKSRFLTQGF